MKSSVSTLDPQFLSVQLRLRFRHFVFEFLFSSNSLISYLFDGIASTRDTFHSRQDVSNTMTIVPGLFKHDYKEAQQSLVYAACPEASQLQLSTFLFCGTSSSVSSRSNRQTISNAFAVLQAMDGTRNSFPKWERERAKKRSAIVSSSRIDFLKALAKRGRACSNWTASRKADGVVAHQVRTKANSYNRRWYSVVRACCCTLKSMALGLEGCLIRCTYGSDKTQHRNRINLEVTKTLIQALGRSINFQHSLYEFFRSAVQR